MEKIVQALQEIQKINEEYELSNEIIEKNLQTLESAKVCTPIIGKFSSGKSAIINTILDYNRLLKVDITPETAIPTEIEYNQEERAIIINDENEEKEISIDEYEEKELDISKVKCVRLQLDNSFLSEISKVMIVDMPGFGSGREVDNRAIDNYLPQSMAYIIAFPADDMIVRNDIANILKELNLHEIPMCIVITKADKKDKDYDKTLEELKESLSKIITNNEIDYCETSSIDGNADELKKFLIEINEKSQSILGKNYKRYAIAAANITESYLKTKLENDTLSESELDEKKDKVEKEMNNLIKEYEIEKKNFESQIATCVDEIKGDILIALESKEDTFITMSMNNQNINEALNATIRNAEISSIKNRFIPKVEKYLKKVNNCMEGSSFDNIYVNLNVSEEERGNGIVATIVAFTSSTLFVGPIIGGIVAGITAIISAFVGDQKQEERRNGVRHQLRSSVYPSALQEVGKGIEKAITEQIEKINESIEKGFKEKREVLEKALGELKIEKEEENLKRNNFVENANRYLERIGEIKDEL